MHIQDNRIHLSKPVIPVGKEQDTRNKIQMNLKIQRFNIEYLVVSCILFLVSFLVYSSLPRFNIRWSDRLLSRSFIVRRLSWVFLPLAMPISTLIRVPLV